MLAKPLSSNSLDTSRTVTCTPACAAVCAIPDPISPQPTTPSFSMAIVQFPRNREAITSRPRETALVPSPTRPG